MSEPRRTELQVAPTGNPPVAGQPGEKTPPTLIDLYRHAEKDLGAPALTRWVFVRAKACGRREVAASRLRRLESLQLTVESKAAAMPSDAAAELVMANGVAAHAWWRAEQELADAVEQVTAAEGVIEALSRVPVTAIRPAAPAQGNQPNRSEAKR